MKTPKRIRPQRKCNDAIHPLPFAVHAALPTGGKRITQHATAELAEDEVKFQRRWYGRSAEIIPAGQAA